MPIVAAIEVAFDPVLRLGDAALRWQALGLTAAIVIGIGLAAARAWYLPPQAPRRRAEPVTHRPLRRRYVGQFPEAPLLVQPPEEPARRRLRLDDLVFIVVGSVPGAVLGGRLVHGLVYLDTYAGQPERLFDPQLGTLSLTGALLGGSASAAYVCRLLGAPVRRWAHAAAIPVLLALGIGKLAQFLGGSGQGSFTDAAWAVSFVGTGPWVSADPATPAHPSQVYEALWLLLGAAAIGVAGGRRRLRLPLGWTYAAAVAWFVVGRLVVGFTWRDEPVLGPFNGEQLVALGLLLVAGAAAWAWRRTVERRRTPVRDRSPDGLVEP